MESFRVRSFRASDQEESGRARFFFPVGCRNPYSAAYVCYANSNNLLARAGTVEFWIKPSWNGNANTSHNFFYAGSGFNNGMMLSIDGANNLRFIQRGDDPSTGGTEGAQNAAQTGSGTKRPERTDLAELLENQAFRPILSAPALSKPDIQMTLRRFELRFLP